MRVQKAYTSEKHVLNNLLFSIKSIFYIYVLQCIKHTHTHIHTLIYQNTRIFVFLDAKHPCFPRYPTNPQNNFTTCSVFNPAPCRGYTPEVCPLHFVPRYRGQFVQLVWDDSYRGFAMGKPFGQDLDFLGFSENF